MEEKRKPNKDKIKEDKEMNEAASSKATPSEVQNCSSNAQQVNHDEIKQQGKTLGDELESWCMKVPAYYDNGRKEYLMKNCDGVWQSLSLAQ